jgi:hypothetical protein
MVKLVGSNVDVVILDVVVFLMVLVVVNVVVLVVDNVEIFVVVSSNKT